MLLRLHDISRSHQRHRNNHCSWMGSSQSGNTCFSREQEGRFCSLRTGAFGEDAKSALVAQNAGCTGERIATPCFSVGLNLAGGPHHETREWITEMTVFGEVVRCSSRSGDDGDGVNVGQVVGSEDGGTVARDVLCSTNSPPQQRA